MDCLDVMNFLTGAIEAKYGEVKKPELDFVSSARSDMGSDRIANEDAYLGFCIHIAVSLGAISFEEAIEMLNNKPHRLKSEDAIALQTIGTNPNVCGLKIYLSAKEGVLHVKYEEEKGKYSEVKGFEVRTNADVVDCLCVAI